MAITLDTLLKFLSNPIVRAICIFIVSAIIASIVVRIVRKTLQARIQDNESRYKASKIVGVAGYVVVAIVFIIVLGGQFSGLTIALGAASAGIAFALQEVIASFAGWLAIAFGTFYKVGDRVQLGGIKGDVIDIGFIRTTIMEIGGWVSSDLYNGRIVRVTNSFVFKEPVFNYSGEFSFVWDEIVLPIKYGSDYKETRKILNDIANEVVADFVEHAKQEWNGLVKSYRIENAKIDPMVTMVANDNWVEFTLRYVVSHRARRGTKDALFSRILEAIDNTHGRISMASMTVHLVEAPALSIRMTSEENSYKE
jgi:small-conductance mechanosensitive channel